MDKKQIRTIVIAAIVIVLGVVGSIYIFSQKDLKINSLQSEKQNLSQSLTQKDSLVNNLEATFDEIESNLKFIKEKRAQLSIQKENQTEQGRDSIVKDVKLMNQMLEESSQKINELQDKLKKSGLDLRSFERRIARMNKNIKDQNAQIADLQKQVEQKTTQVNELNGQVGQLSTKTSEQADSIANQKTRLSEKTLRLNTGYVIYGTYKDLKEKGVLTKEGGILGLGASKTLKNSFNEQNFTKINIQETKSIPLHVKKAKVITDHPADSYKLVKDGNGIAYLEITNPKSFWKISKYAVIEVK